MQLSTMFVCLLLVPSLTLAASRCAEKLKADIYILVDTSGSMSVNEFNTELSFVVGIISNFTIGLSDVQIAFGLYSTKFVHQFDLNKTTNKSTIIEEVLGKKHLKGYTYTYLALEKITQDGYLSSPTHGSRPGVRKYLLLVSDGTSKDRTKTLAAAKVLRDNGVTIIGVDINKAVQTETREVTGNASNFFHVAKFSNLASIVPQVLGRIYQISKLSK